MKAELVIRLGLFLSLLIPPLLQICTLAPNRYAGSLGAPDAFLVCPRTTVARVAPLTRACPPLLV